MTVAAPARAASTSDDRAVAADRTDGARATPSRARRVALAVLALVMLYAGVSLMNDPRGTLGTDTGGKIASLRAMQHHGGLDPDVGYWAERFDPNGDLHPLYYTRHIGDRWVNLTTLPMAYAAYPLFVVLGDRAILLLPMLGAALAALAARALARRIGGERAGWWAFWLLGLASPVFVYALDFWEHSIGLAAGLWAIVLAYDVARGRAGWKAAAAAGALTGFAATMRTDAFVYAAVIGLVTFVALLRRHAAAATMLRCGAAGAVGFVALIAANLGLEELTLGASLRAGRAADTAASAGAGLRERLHEAFTTLLGINRISTPGDWVMGALIVAAVVYGGWRARSRDAAGRRIGIVVLSIAALLYVVFVVGDLGFVPGLLTASPLAAIGLVACAQPNLRWLAAIACLAVPIVWAVQYSGGAAPQWGARYLLVSSALLAIAGATWLARSGGAARVGVVALALLVTLSGVAWLHERSHDVAAGMEQIIPHDRSVLISQEAHVLREGGAFYSSSRRWLTAVGDPEVKRAFAVARDSGARRVTLVGAVGRSRPHAIDGYQRGATRTVEFLPGVVLHVTSYERTS